MLALNNVSQDALRIKQNIWDFQMIWITHIFIDHWWRIQFVLHHARPMYNGTML